MRKAKEPPILPIGERYMEVQPEDIDLSSTLEDTFGKAEIEQSATNLIRFLQERREGWRSFTIGQYYEYCIRHDLDPNEMFFGLMGPFFDDGGLGGIVEAHPYLIHFGNRIAIAELFVNRVSKHAKKRVTKKNVTA